MKNKKAFTLLELLVVILIIGILAGIALPQYKKAVLKSRFATIKNTTRAIYDAEQRYYLANAQYTKKFSDLDIAIPENASNCYISSPGHYILCSLSDKDGNALLQYIIMTETGQTRCDAFPGDSISLPNKVCQTETGKQSASSCGTFCVYYY